MLFESVDLGPATLTSDALGMPFRNPTQAGLNRQRLPESTIFWTDSVTPIERLFALILFLLLLGSLMMLGVIQESTGLAELIG